MSLAYRLATNFVEKRNSYQEQMREICQRPGDMDEDGNPIYVTEQAHKNECDVNHIINKYDKTGIIQHINEFEAQFGDVTGLEFKKAMDLTTNSRRKFDALPTTIRERFNHDPGQLLDFMSNPENRPEAEKLGLVNPDWDTSDDGLGEHIKDAKRKRKIKPELLDPAEPPEEGEK